MRLTYLRSFYAVATAGSFTGAAKLLHISQPTVTTQVRFLEEMYRVELFYRSGRTIKLTPMGEQLYVLAKRTFALESETVQLLRDSGELRTGQLRIGAVGPFHVTEMLALFNQRFPGIHVSVRMGNSESALRALKAYQTDVAVLARFMDDPQLHLVPYSSHPVGILVNHEHPFAHRKSIRIEELEGQRMVLREEGSTTRKALEDALGKAGVQCRVVMEIGSREAIREAVIMGVGIGAVSEIEYVPDPRLRMLHVRGARMYTHAHVVCLEERRSARMVQAFLDVVEELRAASPRMRTVRSSERRHARTR